MNQDWARSEVEAIVSDYFDMFAKYLSGQPYSKAAHRTALMVLLPGRSRGSIEWKHQNISAAMHDHNWPCLPGYKPHYNYQRLLWEVVGERISSSAPLTSVIESAVERAAVPPVSLSLPADFDSPPLPRLPVHDSIGEPWAPAFRSSGSRVDYLAREAANRLLGVAGERFVIQFESARLRRAGAQKLADRIEHVSADRGDGPGFDVKSFDFDGRERLIEVKTTTFGKETPFHLTRNELARSEVSADQYLLYRVFAFGEHPRLFALAGPLSRVCVLKPTQYLARVA